VTTIKRGVIVGLLGGMLAIHGMLFWKAWHLARQGYSDFTIFYTAGTIMRHGLGHHLYDPVVQYRVQHSFAPQVKIRYAPLPYNHPPFEALLFVPLSLLDYPTAYVVWDVINVATLAFLFFLLRRQIPLLETGSLFLWLAVCLAFFPIYGCLLQGQDSILLLLLCVLGFRALNRNAEFLAGCWFALGTFKFQFMIPLVLLLLFWKRRRVGAGFAAASFVLVVLSAALVGWDGLLRYPNYVLQLARQPGLGEVAPALMPNLRGLIEGWSLNVSSSVLNVLVIAGSLVFLITAGWKGRALPSPHFNLQFSLGLLVAVLIAWHTNAHDLSLLILPIVLLADYSRSLLADAPQRKRVLVIPLLPILFSPLWLVLWLGIGRVNVMAIPLLWWAWEISKEISRLDSSAPIHEGNRLVSLC
jgi:hypothetical protein